MQWGHPEPRSGEGDAQRDEEEAGNSGRPVTMQSAQRDEEEAGNSGWAVTLYA